MKQMDLLRKINKMNLGNGKELSRCHLNNFLNGTENPTFLWARRIEIALELSEYSLVRMIGNPTEVQWKVIKEVGCHEMDKGKSTKLHKEGK